MSEKILFAEIVSTKGLKGEVKIKSFTENSLDIVNYDLFDKQGNLYQINTAYTHKNLIIAKIKNIDSIEEAKKVVNKDLYAKKDSLPKIQKADDFYYVDLEKLTVFCNNKKIGLVKNVLNFGAGDILEISQEKGTFMVAFTKENFPEINIKEGYIILSEDIDYTNDKS